MALQDLVERRRATLTRRSPRESDPGRVTASTRSLRRALVDRDDFSYILECNPHAPWRHPAHTLDPQTVAERLAPFADALSISAAPDDIDESLERMAAIRAVVDEPIVFCDVIVEDSQISEARRYGADAVTLLPAALDDEPLSRCLDEARRLAMDVILLVQSAEELERALEHDDAIIGIDNRDFERSSFAVERTTRLAPTVPDERLVVGFGGIETHRRAVEMRGVVDALVTGESALDSDDFDRQVRRPIFGRVKVCGLTRPADAERAWRAGASYGGLIFAPGSARRVDYATARSIVDATPLDFVGVFVGEPIDEVVCRTEHLSLTAIQLHGHEDNEYVLELRRRLPDDVEIWRACHVNQRPPSLEALYADRVLLDNFADGSGSIFDWSVLDAYDPTERRRIVLGGGITPDNAAHADGFGTWAIDVNLGVETTTGVKNPRLLDRLFSALRGSKVEATRKLD
ncbi:MAG: hypothetical protein ACOCV2_05225 [Persicimonas sp.]